MANNRFAKKFVVSSAAIRERLIAYLYDLPLDTCLHGWKVMITENRPNKTEEQQAKYHAMLRDIKQSGKFKFLGHGNWSEEEIKRLLIDAFAAAMAEMGTPLENDPAHNKEKIVPSLDGKRMVSLTVKSSEFNRREASEFIEFLYAYGSDLGVKWTENYRGNT